MFIFVAPFTFECSRWWKWLKCLLISRSITGGVRRVFTEKWPHSVAPAFISGSEVVRTVSEGEEE